MYKNFNISVLMDFYGDLLSPKHRDVINYYYNHDLSLSEISDNLGITRQGIRDSIKRAEQILYDMESKLKLVEKYMASKDKINKIYSKVNLIKNSRDHDEIVNYADEIIQILAILSK